MTNPFYEAGQNRGERVKDLFTRIAQRYDLINDLQSFGLHRLWKRRVIELARVGQNETALDLCCGTGDLAFGLAGLGARVIGADFTHGMLKVAEERGRRRGAVSAVWVQADALRLPFPAATFHVVTVGYGLRNLADVGIGMAEMLRVAKPGARLLVLDFGKPENRIWRACYFAYLKLVVPMLGRLFCGSASAYSYILESLKHYPAQRGIAEQMQKLGLVNVRIVELLGGVMSINYGERPAA